MLLFDENHNPIFLYQYAREGYDGIEDLRHYYSNRQISESEIKDSALAAYQLLEEEYKKKRAEIDKEYNLDSAKITNMKINDLKTYYTIKRYYDLAIAEIPSVPDWCRFLETHFGLKEFEFHGEL